MLAAKAGFPSNYHTCRRHAGACCNGLRGRTGTSPSAVWAGGLPLVASASAGKRSLSGIQRKPMNWFLWAAVAAAAAGIVLFIALWIDVSRGTHTDDRRGATGATLLAWCVGVATVLGIIGLVVNFW
jgi:hypothetical protein